MYPKHIYIGEKYHIDYIVRECIKELYDDAVTVLLSSRFQCATVWGKKEFKYEFVRANGLDSCRELEFLLHLPLV